MFEIEILQINSIRDCDYAFMRWEFAKSKFSIKDYKTVIKFNSPSNDLDDIFRQFNRVTEEDVERLDKMGFKGHSLSVSDVVKADGQMFYCDSWGWKEIEG